MIFRWQASSLWSRRENRLDIDHIFYLFVLVDFFALCWIHLPALRPVIFLFDEDITDRRAHFSIGLVVGDLWLKVFVFEELLFWLEILKFRATFATCYLGLISSLRRTKIIFSRFAFFQCHIGTFHFNRIFMLSVYIRRILGLLRSILVIERSLVNCKIRIGFSFHFDGIFEVRLLKSIFLTWILEL